jgi:F0F1-type ATP synthase assembly protein I
MFDKDSSSFEKIAKSYREIGPYLGLGLQLAATMVFFFFIGKWGDDYLGTRPILTISGAFLGAFSGIYNFIKTVLNLNKKNDK